MNISNQKTSPFTNSLFILLSIIAFGAILLAYSNHFDNDFQFDDRHSITSNNAIREINILRFFTDGATLSSLPTNQSYRPFLTTVNAIDYKLSGGSGTTVFHIHIFISFAFVCILIGVFVKKILDKIELSSINRFRGLLIASIFGLLCANAETVNYITQRAEIEAALFILAGFIAFQKGGVWRSRHLYLIFPLIGFFAKEMAFVFAPLLFLYLLIFEENAYLLNFYRQAELKKWRNALKKALPSIILTAAYLVFYANMLPETWIPGGTDRFLYLVTQPMVMCHYIITFFVPYNLSADSDWKVYSSLLDYRAITGIILVAGLIFIALRASGNRETRLFSFGILWFLIALLPTSSFIPFAEVLNDHRCFIPYIGLAIASVFGLKYITDKYFQEYTRQKPVRIVLFVFLLLFLGANGYGVYQRNRVWHDGMSLWYDVTVKSPENGRGLMNYGLALMAKGDFKNSEKYFNRALIYSPNYTYLHINIGILKGAMGDKNGAESSFKKAISLPEFKHLAWYYYGRYLSGQERLAEAKDCLKNALKIYPDYYEAQLLLMEVLHKTNEWKNLEIIARNILKAAPHDADAKKYLDIALTKKSAVTLMEDDAGKDPAPEKYLNLSLAYFQLSDYKKCIWAAREALKLRNDYAQAYNNIGIACFYLNDYDSAIAAYRKALEIQPGFDLAKNNLATAIAAKDKASGAAPLTASDYLNLSLKYYNEGRYEECIEAAKKSIAIRPSSGAFNNICAAFNQLHQYEKAIEACNEALKLDPNHVLAKGNLDYALKHR